MRFIYILGFLGLILFNPKIQAQTPVFKVHALDTLIEIGDTVVVEIKVEDFDNVVGFTFSLNWDPAVLDFDPANDMATTILPPSFLYNDAMAGSGILTFIWDRFPPTPISLSNDTTIISIVRFTAIGADTTAVDLNSNPTNATVIVFENGTFTQKTPILEDDTVIVVTELPHPCIRHDSLALVSLYDNSDGANWTTTWNLDTVYHSWYGVEVNTSGCLTCLDLDGNDDCLGSSGSGNNLTGTIPETFSELDSLTFLSLGNNNLTGTIPESIGSLDTLIQLYLHNNSLSGSIPDTLGDLAHLTHLNLNNNLLEGCFSDSLANLCSLGEASSLGDLGYNFFNNPMLPWQGDFMRFCLNEPQIGAPCDDGQAGTIGEVITENCICVLLCNNAPTDLSPTLCEDENVTVNGTIYDVNNPSGMETIPGGQTNGCDSVINITLSFHTPASSTLSSTLCPGASITVNGTIYDEANPNGTEVITDGSSNGCDSTVTINLSFFPPSQNLIDDVLCFGQSITVNGTVYDEANPNGTEVIPNGSSNGCDSTIVVDLSFQNQAINNLNSTLCEDESVTVNGTVYDFNNPNGTETIPNGSVSGCDSVINVNLSFFPPSQNLIDNTLCFGQSITVNGTVYDEANPSGTEVIPNGSSNGCDSTIVVDLSFQNQAINNLNSTLCEDESVTVNGTVYDFNNPTGTETIPNGSVSGCDSVINVNLSFHPPSQNLIEDMLCFGQSITVNGTVYDEANPNGTEVIPNGSSNGCDSTIVVDLSFQNQAINNLNSTLCEDESVTVNGTIYDFNNPSGTETIPNGSASGCDSVINVNLSFYPPAQNLMDNTLCFGQSITVNGTVYNEANPSGTEVIPNGSSNGCDSTIVVDLSFQNAAVNNLNSTLCEDESVTVNGTVYDFNNPTGTETIPNGSVSGCDSVINVNLSFFPPSQNLMDNILCFGQSITVSGTVYNEANPSGTEVIPNGSSNGCDSTIVVDLSFQNQAINNLNSTLCEDESVTVNGTVYDFNNPSGTETIPNGSVSGCDSVINVNLSFHPPSQNLIEDMLCFGQSITVNGTVYDEANPNGTEVIPNGSSNGCDSTIVVDLSFQNAAVNNLNSTLCEDESVTVNGTIYDFNNPTGTETIPNGSVSGCDSVINVNLSFFPPSQNLIDNTLCFGQSITVNGTVYDEANPNGTEVIPNGSSNGCDSTIVVDLSFQNSAVNNLNSTLCEDESVTVNGTVYDFNNPTGTETIPNGSVSGCDSVINVNLSFYPPAQNLMDNILCFGQSLTINGTVYDEANPSGTEVNPNASSNGCDSTIVIDLSFQNSAVNNLNSTLCEDESVTVNGTVYDFNNPTGTETIPNGSVSGCDSVINVNLSFYPPAQNLIDNTLCFGQSITVNGTVYDEANPNGTEVIPNGSSNGCDSTIVIDLSFQNSAVNNLNSTLCEDESVTVNGTIYDFNNPSGTETIPNGSVSGCDSVINVNLLFYPPAQNLMDNILCFGQSLTINGTVYNEANPNGTEVIPNGSSNGCDSTIVVDLSFQNSAVNNLSSILCEDETITVNGTIYDFNNPSGTETIPNGSVSGCDSVINVNLSFFPPSQNLIDNTLCFGQSITVNGTVYDEANPNGTEVIPNGSSNGCDSTIVVDLSFQNAAVNNLNSTLCEDESVTVNGTIYDFNNPNGTETIPNGSVSGCDSVINVNLLFYPPSQNLIDYTLCFGQSITVNGTVYDEANPNGTEVIPNGSSNGCDSTIVVDLSFQNAAVNNLNSTLCEDESVTVNGTVYDFNNPTGTETIPNGSVSGCDSVINVNLSFYPPAQNLMDNILCFGQSITVNGTVYDEANPSGTEVIPNGSSNGCDSTIVVDLSFQNAAVNNLNSTLCEDESVTVNGTVYDFNNPTGTETIPNGSVSGCDSVINVNLSFFPPSQNLMDNILCFGQSITVNGTVYNEANPSGTEVIPNGSSNGCDSTIVVDLSFQNAAVNNLNSTLCEDESVTVNGTVYDFNNPNGTETIPNGSVSGCDSVINVNLLFYPPSQNLIDNTLCFGQSITVNGTVYNEANPNGTEVIPNGSSNGCDSTIVVDLSFQNAAINNLNSTLCEDESVTVNGTVYDFNNPTGTETIPNGSASGCDSVINVNLSFFPPAQNLMDNILCFGQSITVNGTVYNEANPSGTEVIPNGSSNGCDSTIVVNLSFQNAAVNNLNSTLCEDESVTVNGTVYDFNNPNGTETIPNGSVSGCDSVINVNLLFYPPAQNLMDNILCFGQSITVNGTVYNEANPSGTEVIPNGSSNGCDSTIVVDLSFQNAAVNNLSPILCENETITVNGTIYNFNDPSGTETIANGSVGGCDSVINVNIMFLPTLITDLEAIICDGENIVIGNSTFSQSGFYTETLAAVNGCDSIVELTLTVNDAVIPIAVEDNFVTSFLIPLSNLNLIENDSLNGLSRWALTITEFPSIGELIENQDGTFTYIPETEFEGDVSFQYQLCNQSCPDACSATFVNIKVESEIKPNEEEDIIITPNGDGKNEFLIFDGLDNYPGHQLFISNRWGSLVYKASPYNNDWYGQNQKGNELPEGTYYYLLKLSLSEGQFIWGSVTIKR